MSLKIFFTVILYISNAFIFTNGQSLLTSIQIQVDFSSIVSYIGYECGGPLLVGDSTVYPPCISFKDVGIRARQYLSGSITIPDNNSLYISVLNAATAPIVTGDASQLGNLFGFCTVDLSGATTTTRITLDGTSATGSFLSLIAPTVPNTSYQCSTGTVVKIRYLNFVDWGNQNIFYSNVNQVTGPTTKTAFSFLFCIVSQASSIFNIQPKGLSYDYGTFALTVNICTFIDIYSGPSIGVGSSVIPPFNLVGVTFVSSASKFLNSTLNASPLFYIEKGMFGLKTGCLLDIIEVGNSYPLVKAFNVENNFYFYDTTVSNCVLSTLLHSSNSINSIPIIQEENTRSLNIKDSIITTSASGLPNSFFHIQSYQHPTVRIYVVYTQNNQVASGKTLFWLENVNVLSKSLSISSSFTNGIYVLDSYLVGISDIIDSAIPFSGDNSIINSELTALLNTSNYGYCIHCTITLDGTIVHDTL